MATQNIFERGLPAERPAGFPRARWNRLRISPSSICSALILLLIVGLAVLFRGFV